MNRRALPRRLLRGAAGLTALLWAGVVAGPLVLPYHVVYVRSGSMAPALPVGALAVLVAVEGRAVNTGDVVTVSRPEGRVTHRVVAVNDGVDGRRLTTRGDANAVADPWDVPADGRVWLVAASVPLAGYALAAMTSPLLLVAAGIVLGVIAVRAARPGTVAVGIAVAGASALAALAIAPAGGVRAGLAADSGAPANNFELAALAAPGTLSASAAGNDVSLSWNAGVNGDGYTIEAAANGANANCSSASFSALSSGVSTSFTDTGRSSPAGTYMCYRVTTTYGSSWTSVVSNPTAAARIGFVAESITMTNAGNTSGCSGSGSGASGTAGTLDCGDVLTVTFNQAVDTATGPAAGNTVCTDVLGVIRLASTTTTGLCTGLETIRLGTLTGGALGDDARFAATYAWSNGNRTLTVTIGNKVSGLLFPTVSLFQWALTPVSTIRSATGAVAICTSNTGDALCQPTTLVNSSF